MTKKILAALLLSGSLMVAACNTVEGAGKDVQSAGQAVEEAADKPRRTMQRLSKGSHRASPFYMGASEVSVTSVSTTFRRSVNQIATIVIS